MTVNPRRGVTAGAATSRYTYKPRDSAVANERLAKYRSGGKDSYLESSINVWTPKVGDNWVRLLPPTWMEAEHYAFDLYFHYEVGPDKNSYLCVERMAAGMAAAGFPIQSGTICGLCEEYRRASAAGEQEYARALDSALRLAAWIIDRKEETKGVQLWAYSHTIDREIIEQSRDRRTGEVLMIDHPVEGFDVEFVRVGQGMTTKYSGVKLSRQPSPISDQQLVFAVENPIPKILVFYDNAHVMESFGGPAAVQGMTDAAKDSDGVPDGDDKIPHDPPAETKPSTPAAGTRTQVLPRTPVQTGAAAATPAQSTAAPAATGNAARRRAATKPATVVPDFAAMDVNAQLDWADTHNIIVPDDIGDEEIPAFLAEEAAKLPQ